MAIAKRVESAATDEPESGWRLKAPLRVVPNTRPLLFHQSRLYCSRFDRILVSDDLGKSFQQVCRLSLPSKYRWLKHSPLAQRVTRCGVYRMRVLNNGACVYVFRGGIYLQRPSETNAELRFVPPRGSRPVSLAVGADDQIVFGEYFGNPERDEVHIYGSRDGGESWRSVYTFPAGDIRHVHGISFDPWKNGYWICTGDVKDENQLLFANHDFSQVDVVRQGGQQNRFYYLQVLEDEIVTATDTPHEQNHITVIDKTSGQAQQAGRIENTNFYSCQVGGNVVLSTNVEPSESNDLNACHIWIGSAVDGFHKAATMPIDNWERLSQTRWVRNGLFQYPRVFFPEGNNPSEHLVCQPIGLKPHANAMLVFSLPSKPSSQSSSNQSSSSRSQEARHDRQAA